MSESHEITQAVGARLDCQVGQLFPERETACGHGCNGCEDCTDYEDDEAVCERCHGDGADPWTDYLLPCPACQGEQQP